MPLLFSFWREIAIGALCLALAGMTNLWLSARDDVAICKTNHENAVKQAQAETLKAEIISKRTVEEINHDTKILVEQAKTNAVENYKRRFGRVGGVDSGTRSDLGTGITLPRDGGVRVDSSDSTRSIQADGAEGVAGESVGISLSETCIPDPRFLNDAATAAAVIDGWLTWATKNGFEYEK